IGNMTGRLMGRRLRYVTCDSNPLYLHALRNRFLRTPNVSVRRVDPSNSVDFEALDGDFDTALCLNVLEYLDQPEKAISSLHGALKPGGALLALVPQGPRLFTSVDRALGQKRRFRESELRALLESSGFRVEGIHQLNKIGTPAWWLYGKVLGRRHISKWTLKLFDKTVWFWRRVDVLLPWHGLTLIAVARRPK
ncbi:MAG: class I SAM-dependent methyltransferase, partial [Bryobacteraceae bacterium]